MARREGIESPTPPGAGRIRDLNWPDYTTAGSVSASLTNLRCRITGAAFGGQFNNFGSLAIHWLFYNGTDVISFGTGGGAGAGGSVSFLNNTNVHIRTSPAIPYWPADDDWNVQRILFVAAINGTVTTSNDAGIELLTSGGAQTTGILKTPENGFGFQFGPGGTHGQVNWITQNTAGGAQSSTLAVDGVAGFNIQQLHCYEMRIFSAMPGLDPFIKLLIDDNLVSTLPFNAGAGRMPANGESGLTGCGFFPTVIYNAANSASMVVKNVSFQASTSELSCL